MQRYKPPVFLSHPRDLVVGCVPLKSNVNVSAVARTSSCLGVRQLICCGTAKLLFKVAREATSRQVEPKDEEDVEEKATRQSAEPWFRVVNTLHHPLKRLKEDGYQVVGLEQTTSSTSLYDFRFLRRTVLVIGSEIRGIPPDILALCDRVVEVPLHGPPHSLNVASAAAMGIYEYCRQHPS